MSKVKLHTGSVEDMGRRFVDAWKRASAGKPVDETHLTFLDLETMLAAFDYERHGGEVMAYRPVGREVL